MERRAAINDWTVTFWVRSLPDTNMVEYQFKNTIGLFWTYLFRVVTKDFYLSQ